MHQDQLRYVCDEPCDHRFARAIDTVKTVLVDTSGNFVTRLVVAVTVSRHGTCFPMCVPEKQQ